MQDSELSYGSKKRYGQHDCMVVRVCKKAYVEARQSVQWVSAGIGAGAFNRAFVTHRNAVTTAVKRISRTSERSGKEKEEMLNEDVERNVRLSLHNSFCRNRESNVDPLPCCKQRVEEQKCYRTASNSVRIANDVLQGIETESAESMSHEQETEH